MPTAFEMDTPIMRVGFYQSLSTMISSEKQSDWNQIDWRQLEEKVFQRQVAIYNSSKRFNEESDPTKKAEHLSQVHYHQEKRLSSSAVKLLAWRYTMSKIGSKTAGIDNLSKKDYPKEQWTQKALSRRVGSSARPIKRIYIPKPGTDEKRPLGIPTLEERAKQRIVKLALEPQWEALFESCSYGFRPGRSTHDAIAHLRSACVTPENEPGKFVLDADIAKCFDRINHQALLAKINGSPRIMVQVKAWLEAGVLDDGVPSFSEVGTPQGSVVSPLLANIALHGRSEYLAKRIKERFGLLKGRYAKDQMIAQFGEKEYLLRKAVNNHNRVPLTYVRYADDFVIISPFIEVVTEAKAWVSEFLAPMGLELSEKKTKIVNTYHRLPADDPSLPPREAGFDFLGVRIQQFDSGNGKQLRLIRPSDKACKKHLDAIDKILVRKNDSQETVISALNRVIRGWCNYYRHYNSARTYGKRSRILFQKLRSWVKRKHSSQNLARIQVIPKYFKTLNGKPWVFCATGDQGALLVLKRHQQYKCGSKYRHFQVDPGESPYTGHWLYWGKRYAPEKYILCPKRRTAYVRQKGICPECGKKLYFSSYRELDHKIPKAFSKKHGEHNDNLRLLHYNCHKEKTKVDNNILNSKPFIPPKEWIRGLEELKRKQEREFGKEAPDYSGLMEAGF